MAEQSHDTARMKNGMFAESSLTPRSLLRIEYFAPRAAISDYVTTFYHFRCNENYIRDTQPASIGQLNLFPLGKGRMLFQDGSSDPSHQTNLLTPLTRAAAFEVKGPFHAIGAAMTPLGWASLTGLDADKHADRLHRAADWLHSDIEALGNNLCEGYRKGALSAADCIAGLSAFIGQNLKPVNPRHKELIKQTIDWLGGGLDPDVDALLARCAYSERQVQRLVERYFGFTPQKLKRKYRALRTVALLGLPQLTDEVAAQIDDAFYDQSHMIREIAIFAGRTPARLANDSSPYLSELLIEHNFRDVTIPSNLPGNLQK